MVEENFEEFEQIDLSSLDQMMESFPDLGTEGGEQNPQPEEELEQEDIVKGDGQDEEPEEGLTEEENSEEEPSAQGTKDSSPLTPYAKMLVAEGLLPNIDLEKFDGTVESLLEAQRTYDETRFNEYKESTLDPRVKWLQDNLEQGVPLKNLLEIEEAKFNLEKISEDSLESDETLQREVIRNYYKETTSFSEEKINSLINRLETVGDLKDESLSTLPELKSIIQAKEQKQVEQAKLAREQAIKQQEEVLSNFKTTLDKTEEIIKGVKMTPQIKDRIYKTLTTPVAVDEQSGVLMNKIAQARAEDPLNFEISLAYLFEITSGFKDWTALTSSGKRKAIDEFQESLKNIDLGKEDYRKQPSYSKKEAKSYLEEMERISKQF